MEMFNAAAEALGMTPEELFAELQAGKTPQEILDENDVDLATLRESLQELMPEGVGHFRGGGRRMGRMGGFGKLGGGPMGGTDAVAEALGMTPEELSAELQAGKTLEEIIEAQGHDPEEFLSDVAEESIAQAVEDGRMTQEQADWLLQGLEQGYFPGPMGHGEGGPCGGGGGRGPWGGEKTPPSSE